MDWLFARVIGIGHILRWHQVEWKYSPEDTCYGDIVCHTCNLIIWCRWYDPTFLGGKRDL